MERDRFRLGSLGRVSIGEVSLERGLSGCGSTPRQAHALLALAQATGCCDPQFSQEKVWLGPEGSWRAGV